MTGRQPTEKVLESIASPLRERGLDIEDVEVSTAGRRKLVRILVDKDGGVTLDDVADATNLVSSLLDEHDVLDEHPYTLEVTSPGVDRPLTAARHWRRNLDRLVVVQLGGGDQFTGRIMEAGDSAAELEIGDTRRSVAYADVVKARVEIEFNRKRPATAASTATDSAGDSTEAQKE